METFVAKSCKDTQYIINKCINDSILQLKEGDIDKSTCILKNLHLNTLQATAILSSIIKGIVYYPSCNVSEIDKYYVKLKFNDEKAALLILEGAKKIWKKESL